MSLTVNPMRKIQKQLAINVIYALISIHDITVINYSRNIALNPLIIIKITTVVSTLSKQVVLLKRLLRELRSASSCRYVWTKEVKTAACTVIASNQAVTVSR